MTQMRRQVAVLFLLASVGVLVMLGLVVDRALGPIALVVYVVLVTAPLVAGIVAAARRRSRLTAGRTCTCCTGSVHDPVQVV
ncbi:MAG: hypothetical protein QOE99_1212 [Actinomycetota bacterium]|nr:hypothetical protein [Actinomycetota bacterium]